MSATLLIQVLLALIGQAGPILAFIEKLKNEQRTTLTNADLDELKAIAPVAHSLLMAAAGTVNACGTCAKALPS